ncbi:SNARE protein SED5/Syntaxin 5 [Trachipleistophora hominis]|uniref:SNARE protein SED5/Syntaxin 5 n=1 Tax=Trachipleistophora hominis TaxID=72359 RepID=L7JZU0_TRAHO|nr:SNARE protein SED5/Syntaxin 5 [Trachipleistophora hominis]
MQETTSTIKRQNYAMLNTQITEIGQLMSDISMHINIQGENLKRIDEVIERVDDNLFGGFREIEKVWNSVKGRRKSIGVFVAVWIVLILLYVLFRSI